ncbi:lecithin retinol acyltransferase family protein [Tamlana sp. I1]|uniref:lecithin retinol acyltransferase family protein n=1 Tax=Tamlana sp. I1 TaxID=2762061 RepID=UPI00188DEAAB|nr:lecithin retinol acyltransferase family protein [Tamlana sp. I1]
MAKPLAKHRLKVLEKRNKYLSMTNYLMLINDLHPVDVIVAKMRSGLERFLIHYIVYLGSGVFIGNMKGCVKQVSNFELMELLKKYKPINIRRFTGSHFEIQKAIIRAKQKLGYKYSFLGFNCEHFANWVQFGKESSNQVTNGFLIASGLVRLKLISSNNGKR